MRGDVDHWMLRNHVRPSGTYIQRPPLDPGKYGYGGKRARADRTKVRSTSGSLCSHDATPYAHAACKPRDLMGTGPLFMTGIGNGQVRLWLGGAAKQEKRRLGRRIDDAIARALGGNASDADLGELEAMAEIAGRLARR
jgi:hypothetical protein